MSKKTINRKEFISYSAMIGAAGALGGVSSVITSCAGAPKEGEVVYAPLQSEIEAYYPDLVDQKAIDGALLKAGIIGCGSRGGGAVMNFLNSAPNLTITAMGDIFTDRLEGVRKMIKEQKQIEVSDDHVFYGFDAYKKVIDSDVDMVIITTPTVFHPEHMKYAIEKGKHVFVEKPACVDAVGARTVLATCKMARAKGLSIVTGTQRHHSRDYVESYKKVRQGYIGDITGAQVYWNQGGPWFANKKPEWTDMEYMLRDFFSWNWLCGDHLLDQGVHNVDVFCWFSHLKPVKAVGFGSRLRRTTGDIYDNFSVDIEFEGGVHVHQMARQIDGCANNIGERIQGTKGSWSSYDMAIRDLEGNIVWQYDKNVEEGKQNDPYVLEHANLVNHIRTNKPICLAETTVYSTVACVLGRESAYNGKMMTWDELMASDLDLMPKELALKNVDMSKYVPPVPGKGQKE